MRHHPRWFRYAAVLLLPCSLLGGPLATGVRSAACPHHHAMQQHAGACYCDRMTRDASLDVVSPGALPAPLPTELVAEPVATHLLGPASSWHDSPAYPPRLPPPKSLLG